MIFEEFIPIRVIVNEKKGVNGIPKTAVTKTVNNSLFIFLVKDNRIKGFSDESKFKGRNSLQKDSWVGVNVGLPIFDSGLCYGAMISSKGEYPAKAGSRT